MKNFSIYTIVIAICLIFVLNPIVGYWLTASRGFAFYYMVIFDVMLVAIVITAIAYLKFEKKSIFYFLTVSILLFVPALIVAESVYIHFRFTKLSLAEGGDIFEKDLILGFKLKLNANERHFSPDFDAVYVIDEDGLRQGNQSQAVQQTVHVFGDSFTFGFGVDNQETWPELLKQRADQPINVMNYAVIGYGLEQMYLSLERHADRIKQDDIVLFAPISDDLQRNLLAKTHVCMTPLMEPERKHYFPKYEDKTWRAVPLEGECSYFWDSLLGNALWPISLGGIYRSWRLHSMRNELIDNADWLFQEARKIATEKGAEFQVIFLATPEECVTQRHAIDLASLQTPSHSLLDYCPDDVEEARSLRFNHDRHYNVKGHRWAAAAILETLLGLDLVGGRRSASTVDQHDADRDRRLAVAVPQ